MNGSPCRSFALDALTGALFLLTALGVVATRQVLASLQLFIAAVAAADAFGGASRHRTGLHSSLGRRGDHHRHQNAADPMAAAAYGQRGGLSHARDRTGPQHPEFLVDRGGR